MEKEKMVYWLKRYEIVDAPASKAVEEKLTKKFQETGLATKADLEELLEWKFATMKGRLRRELNLLAKYTDDQIIQITRRVFQTSDELEKIKMLKSIKGIGNAVCSVVLTFHNPQKYGVFDIHAWRELFGKESESKDYGTPKALLRFFERLRGLSEETGLTCREVEKAHFIKNLEENRKKHK